MAQIADRMIRAAKLDASLYDEIARDETTMGEAVTVVLIAAAAAGLGAALAGPIGLIGGAVVALVGWFVQAVLAYYVGTKMIPDSDTRTDLSSVLRVTGYASAPGVIAALGFIPVLGTMAMFAAGLWQLAAFIVAIRVVMNFDGNGKAVMVVLIGWVVKMAIAGLFMFVGLGGALMMAS